MALLAVQRPTPAGLEVALAAAAGGGDSFPNNGSTYFVVNNGSGAPINVTFDSPNPCSFGVTGAAHDLVVAVPAGDRLEIGPFSQARYNDGSGTVQVSYSDVTTLTVAAVAR